VTPAVLVMAKAPVPGEVKTRLGADIGPDAAAEIAAAAVLDTLDVCRAVFDDCHLALAGDLAGAVQRQALLTALAGWTVHPQRGMGFAARLAHAHADVARATAAPVVQIGMDTPHLRPDHLRDVAALVGRGHDAVLGPAEDGGWWVLAVTDARLAEPLAGVEMSTRRTYDDTLAALRRTGATVAPAAVLRDVDTAGDADLAAAAAPDTRFARLWARHRDLVPRP
jgi:rSAM/selenodomain-associated transferase 1